MPYLDAWPRSVSIQKQQSTVLTVVGGQAPQPQEEDHRSARSSRRTRGSHVCLFNCHFTPPSPLCTIYTQSHVLGSMLTSRFSDKLTKEQGGSGKNQSTLILDTQPVSRHKQSWLSCYNIISPLQLQGFLQCRDCPCVKALCDQKRPKIYSILPLVQQTITIILLVLVSNINKFRFILKLRSGSFVNAPVINTMVYTGGRGALMKTSIMLTRESCIGTHRSSRLN